MTTWRISCPPDIRRNQLIALEIDTLFILRQNGPLAFSVQDIRYEKPFEVRLGDPHKCNCRCFKIVQDLCPHICWIILKKFKISYSDSASFQRGMSAQELDNWFTIDKCVKAVRRLPKIQHHIRSVPKRRLKPDDTCAICLARFASGSSNVTHCKYSCGNVVHLRCIEMLMKHQNKDQADNRNEDDSTSMLKCPLCRGNFNYLAELKIEFLKEHRKSKNKPSPPQTHPVACTFCRNPVVGNLYRCSECDQIFLCGDCLRMQDFLIYHGKHYYAVKKKSGGPWRRLGKVEEHLKAFNRNGNFHVAPLPPLTPTSSSLHPSTSQHNSAAAKNKNLLEFSKGFPFNCDKSGLNNSYRNTVNAIKTDRHFERNHLCAVCTDVFEANTYILASACGHYFHCECIEEHINDPINEKRCPLDNIKIYYSPIKQQRTETKAQKGTEINLGPLEVRVSRMHLEQRPKDSNKISATNAIAPNKSTTVKVRKKRVPHKEHKPLNLKEGTTLDERLLGPKVNPLMTILMSPYLKQLIEEHEEKRDQPNDVNIKRKSLDKIKVKSLEFPDECDTRVQLQKNRLTPSPSQWVQKTLKRKVADSQIRSDKRCDL